MGVWECETQTLNLFNFKNIKIRFVGSRLGDEFFIPILPYSHTFLYFAGVIRIFLKSTDHDLPELIWARLPFMTIQRTTRNTGNFLTAI